MPIHLRCDPTTGHLYRNSASGHLVRCPDPPIIPAVACGGCSPDAPGAWRMTLAGMTTCSVCYNVGANSNKVTGTINGTYDLPYDAINSFAGSCVYQASLTSSILFQRWSATGCTGSVLSSVTTILPKLTVSPGLGTMSLRILDGSGTVLLVSITGIPINPDCRPTGGSVTASHTRCGCRPTGGAEFCDVFGGSATLTPL